jgi:hypothetical protein
MFNVDGHCHTLMYNNNNSVPFEGVHDVGKQRSKQQRRESE